MIMITQFTINMLVPIFLCTFLGMFIDRKLETSYFVVILFFAGALAGFRNVAVFAKKIYTQKSDSLYERAKKEDGSHEENRTGRTDKCGAGAGAGSGTGRNGGDATDDAE